MSCGIVGIVGWYCGMGSLVMSLGIIGNVRYHWYCRVVSLVVGNVVRYWWYCRVVLVVLSGGIIGIVVRYYW